MATGASNAELAVILIDARKGVLAQTRRHSFICSLLGIRHVVLAVNKIDLVDYHQDVFDRIVGDYRGLRVASSASPRSCRSRSRRATATTSIERSGNTPWYPRPDAARASRDASTSRATISPSRSAFRCNGSTGRISISAAMPARSRPAASRKGDAVVVAASGPQLARRARSSPTTATPEAAAGRRRGDADARRRDRHRARRRSGRPERAARGRRSVRRPPDLDGRGAAAARAAPICCAIGTKTVPATITAHQAQDRRQHARAPRGRARSASTTSASAISRPASPIAFDPYAREPRDRRLHPDRPLHQPHRRRRHDRVRAAPRHQYPLAAAADRQGRARRS